MSRKSAAANAARRRAAGLPAVDPAMSARMKERRAKGQARTWAEFFAGKISPPLIEYDPAVAHYLGPASRHLLKKKPRAFAFCLAYSRLDWSKRGSIWAAMKQAGFPHSPSLSVQASRMLKNSYVRECLAEIMGTPLNFYLLLPLAVKRLLRIVQNARLPRDRLNAAALIFGVADALERELGPTIDGFIISDEERLARLNALVAELSSGGILFRHADDIEADRAAWLCAVEKRLRTHMNADEQQQ